MMLCMFVFSEGKALEIKEAEQRALPSLLFGQHQPNLTTPVFLTSSCSDTLTTTKIKLYEQKGPRQKEGKFSLVPNFVPGDFLCHEENHS